MYIPKKKEFLRGIKKYRENEGRDPMYKIATFLVSHFWGEFSNMADGLGVILLTWNQAFYRYGRFDFNKLEFFINKNFSDIEYFRKKNIFELDLQYYEKIKFFFNELLIATEIIEGSKKGNRSPVSVAKALHILCPDFFPLWDESIAKKYGCYYSYEPEIKYLNFSNLIKEFARVVKEYKGYPKGRTLIKLIDEYNYSKYTKEWI